jgi:anti-sigma factor RsiW
MNLDNHQRARQLLRAARIEGISDEDQRWLDSHVTTCDACANETSLLSASIASWRALNVHAPADLVQRTALAVNHRAAQLRLEREPTLVLWLAAGLSTLWAILTTPYVWAAFSWLGRLVHTGDIVWQFAFVMWWFLPATVLGAAAGWRRSVRRQL